MVRLVPPRAVDGGASVCLRYPSRARMYTTCCSCREALGRPNTPSRVANRQVKHALASQIRRHGLERGVMARWEYRRIETLIPYKEPEWRPASKLLPLKASDSTWVTCGKLGKHLLSSVDSAEERMGLAMDAYRRIYGHDSAELVVVDASALDGLEASCVRGIGGDPMVFRNVESNELVVVPESRAKKRYLELSRLALDGPLLPRGGQRHVLQAEGGRRSPGPRRLSARGGAGKARRRGAGALPPREPRPGGRAQVQVDPARATACTGTRRATDSPPTGP